MERHPRDTDYLWSVLKFCMDESRQSTNFAHRQALGTQANPALLSLYLAGVVAFAWTVPLITHAQVTINTILREIASVIALLPPFLLAVALLVFVWGMTVFIWSAGDDAGRASGRRVMIWGIIALFVIVSLWGIVAIVLRIFGLEQGADCPPPQIGRSDVSTCN